MEYQLVNKVHNFGIYRKGGKRCILQLDFPGRAILVIQKGHIKKTHPMSVLEHYDTEDGLHITLKLKDGEMVFEADNLEEKYNLCCLLGLAMQIGMDGDEDSIDSGHGHGFLSDHHLDNSDVIKDGLLEKKGNTAITTWNKRRIRLVPGELSYFKPGEELALNVIQLWKDRCVLKKHQHNGFTLTTRNRVYSFRTVHDYKATHMTEIARDDWFEAFERAMNMPPTTSKILDMNVFSDTITMRHHRHNDTRSSIDSNASHRSSSGSVGSNNSSNNNKHVNNSEVGEENFYDDTPDVLEQFMAASCLYTQPVPKSLRGNTLPSSPRNSIPQPTATTKSSTKNKNIFGFLKRSKSSENLLESPPPRTTSLSTRRQSREFHGISPLLAEETITDHDPILASSASSCTYTQPIPKRLRGNTLPLAPFDNTPPTPPTKDKHILAFLKRSQSTENLVDSTPPPAALNARRQSREFHGISPLSSENAATEDDEQINSSPASAPVSAKNEKDDVFMGTAAAFRAKLAQKGGKSSSLKNYKAKKEMKEINSNNNYKMDGMKRGVCKAYNMFLVGADFKARSLDRNPARGMPQFHPIIEVKSPTKTTPPVSIFTQNETESKAEVEQQKQQQQQQQKQQQQQQQQMQEVVQSPPLTSELSATTIEKSLDIQSSTPPSESSSSMSTMTSTSTTATQGNNSQLLYSLENQIKADISDLNTLLYSEAKPSVDLRRAFPATNNNNTCNIDDDDDDIYSDVPMTTNIMNNNNNNNNNDDNNNDNENVENDDDDHQKREEEPWKLPRDLLTFSTFGMIPSTEEDTLFIRDKPTITISSDEPLTTSTPTTTPKNAKNAKHRPSRIPPLPTAPPPVTRAKSPARTFHTFTHSQTKTKTQTVSEKSFDPPFPPPPLSLIHSTVPPLTHTPIVTSPPVSPPPPPPPPLSPTSKPTPSLIPPPVPDHPNTPAISGPYSEIADIVSTSFKQTNTKPQGQGLPLKQIHPSPNPPPAPPVPDHPNTPAISGPYSEIADTMSTSFKQTNTKTQGQGLRLKQIHWTKVGNNQLTASIWKDVNDVTDKLDLTELEEQFSVVNSKSNRNKNNNSPQEKQMLVDAKRAQNLGILFCGLKLESIQRLVEALNSTTELDTFPVDRIATLKRYQPTTEELEMYRGLSKKGDVSSLHDVDRFMVHLCEIPKLGLRLDLVLTLWEFPGQYAALEDELTDILTASDQLLDSVSLAKVLEYILAIGNVMNSTWGSKQDANGFQLSSLDKILSVKGKDSKTTLCGYLVKQLKRNDSALLTWPDSVQGVTKCSGYSTKAVGAEIDVMRNDLQKIRRSLKSLRHISNMDKGFMLDVQSFVVEHDKKLSQLDVKYTKLNDKYKQLLTRFGEPANNSTESIFTIVCGFVEKFNQAKLEQET